MADHNAFLEAVGVRLKEARSRHGWTLTAASERLGVGFQTLYRWEGGKVDAGLSGLALAAKTYGVPVVWLLGGTYSWTATDDVLTPAKKRLT